ncbi:flagellar hook-associated protein FlgL [Desulfurispira natronophila]|uniref:Flagellin-like hook-associated protein FlgL n=1 Tax=Desulfurispira natronophila TaxID=682562 RepID=A0A7W7Y625_9BACT|nr:flagellar hook-associated protein FlgL [Desulfurispira natronophila]MBB5022729.1 flagellin-like hook-associated protein FlgL [Desulfurispira natronophila]
MMRVTSNMLSANFLGGVNKSLNNMLESNKQIASNRTVLAPSSDPVRVSQALSFQNSIDLSSQYQRNISNTKTWLDLSDGSLQSISSILQKTKNDFALAGSSDSMSPDARKALANDVEAMRRELISLGNTKHLDRYIFGGHQTRSEPFQERKQEIEIIRNGSYVGTSGAVLYSKGVFSDLPELPGGDYEIHIDYDDNTNVATVSMRDSKGRVVSLDSNGSDNSGGGNMNNLTTVARYHVNPGDYIDTGRGVALEIPQGFRGGQRIQFSYSPGDSLAYLGDSGVSKSQVGINDQVDVNVPGSEIFSKTAKMIETTFTNTTGGVPIKNITKFGDIDHANVQRGDTIDINGLDHSGNRIGAARILSPKAAMLDLTNATKDERTFSMHYSNDRLDGVSKNITVPQHGYDNHNRLANAIQGAINESLAPANNHPVYFSGGMDASGETTGPLYSAGGTVTNRLFATGTIAYDQFKQISLKVDEDASIGDGPLTFQIHGFDEKTQYASTEGLNSAASTFLGKMTIDNPEVGFKYSIKDEGYVSGTDFGLNIGFLGYQSFSAGSTFDFAMDTEPAVAFTHTGGAGSNLEGLKLQYDNLRYNGQNIESIVLESVGVDLTYTINTADGNSHTETLNLGPDAYKYPVEIPGTGASIRLDQSVGDFSLSAGATATFEFDNSRTLSPNLDLTGYTGDGETMILRARSAVDSPPEYDPDDPSTHAPLSPGNYSAAGTINFGDGQGGFFDVLDNHGNVTETVYVSSDGRTSLSNGVQVSFDPEAKFQIGESMNFSILPQNAVGVRSDGSNLLFETRETGEQVNLNIYADPYSKLGLDHNVIGASGVNNSYSIDPDLPVEDMLRFIEDLYGNTVDAYITENGKLAFKDLHPGHSRLEVNLTTNNEGIRHMSHLANPNYHPIGGEFNDYYIMGEYTGRSDNRLNITLDSSSAAGTSVVGRDQGISLTIEDRYGNRLIEDYPLGSDEYHGEPIYIGNGLSIRIPIGTPVQPGGITTGEVSLRGNGNMAFGSSAVIQEGHGVDAFRSLQNLEDALNLDIGQPGIKAPSDWELGSGTVPGMMGDFTGNYNTEWTFDVANINGSSESVDEIKRGVEYTRTSDVSSADNTLMAYNPVTKRFHLSAMGSLKIEFFNPPKGGQGGSYETTEINLSGSPSGGIFGSLQEIEDYINRELKKDSVALRNGIQVNFNGSPQNNDVTFSVNGNGNTNIRGVHTTSTQYGNEGYDNGLFGRQLINEETPPEAVHHAFETNFNHFEHDQRTLRIPYGDEVINIVVEDLTKDSGAAKSQRLDFTRYENGDLRSAEKVNDAMQFSLQKALDEHFGGEGTSPITPQINGAGTNNDPYALQFVHDGSVMQGIDDSYQDLFGLRKPGVSAEMTVYDFKGNHVRRIEVNTANEEVYMRDGVSLAFSQGEIIERDKFKVAMGTGASSEVGNLERALDQTLDSLAKVGSTSHRLDLLDQRYENITVMQKEFVNKAMGATMEDMIEVATRLEREKTSYESALAVHGNASRLSLLNYI